MILTEFEIEFIIKNSPFVSDRVGAEQLSMLVGRKISQWDWTRERMKLGLHKKTNRYHSTLDDVKMNERGQSNAVLPKLPSKMLDEMKELWNKQESIHLLDFE